MNTNPIQSVSHGLDWSRELAEQTDTDYLAGIGSLPNIASIPKSSREAYLPKGEIQRGAEDTQSCASFSPTNGFEAMFTYMYQARILTTDNRLWLENNGYVLNGKITFSDAFVAINSGTTRAGNSLKAPLDAIHKLGMIPEYLLTLEPWMTLDEFLDPRRITDTMNKLGAEFAARFICNYERVYEGDFGKWLETDLIDVGGYAWPFPDEQGVYHADNRAPNHAFLLWNIPKYYAFDSYANTFDGTFVKILAPNYDLVDYGYRILVSKQTTAQERTIIKQVSTNLSKYGLLSFFWDWLDKFNRVIKGVS